MIFFGILVSLAAIGTMCWLLFNLAVFALPFFAGVTLGTWAYGTGAGWLGATVIGAVAVGITAFLRVAGMAAPGDAGGSLVRG